MEQGDLLRNSQMVMLSILKEIDVLCKKHNIKYFLDGGTLLGAIRHKGFIPWDDDLDIGMLRSDYEKFLQVAQKELGDKYFVQDWFTDTEFGFWFTKIRLRNTLYLEKSSSVKKKHNEFFIDIFPYDNYPDDPKIRNKINIKLEFLKRCLLAKTNYPMWNTSDGFSIKRFLIYKFLYVIAFFIPKVNIIKKYIYYSQKFNKQTTKKVFPQGNSKSGKFCLEREYFEKLHLTEFENGIFPVLDDYDDFLKILYGDYMLLPPIEKRLNRHNVTNVVLPTNIIF